MLGNEDLSRLLAKCANKDQRAWAQIVERFSPLVYSVARRHHLNEDDCADVFQSTFKALYENLDRLHSSQALPKWLAVTAANQARRILRSAKNHASVDEFEGTLEELVLAEEATAEKEAIAASQAFQLREALKKLGGKCAKLLTLLYLHDNPSYEAIASKLGMPVGSLGPTRGRCLMKLRNLLDQASFVP